jgi:hypothetical protein
MCETAVIERTYWIHFKSGRANRKLGPFATRQEAIAAGLKQRHKRGTVMTGYGSEGAFFDIQWHCAEPTMAQANDFMVQS